MTNRSLPESEADYRHYADSPSAEDWADTWFQEVKRCRLLLREATELIYRFHVTDSGTGLHDAAASFLARMNRGRK